MISRVDHISIQTENFKKALEFYNELLGFQISVAPFDFKNRRLCYLDAKSIRIELHSIKPESNPNAHYTNNRLGLDHIAFVTSNLKNLIDRLTIHGIRIIKPPFSLSTTAEQSTFTFVEGPVGPENEFRQEDQK